MSDHRKNCALPYKLNSLRLMLQETDMKRQYRPSPNTSMMK